jgi:hypothetical protein
MVSGACQAIKVIIELHLKKSELSAMTFEFLLQKYT